MILWNVEPAHINKDETNITSGGNRMSALALKRIEELEAELQMLRKEIKTGKVIRLKNLWDGLKVSDEDFEEAKRSLFGRDN
jgi:hypothetical protein